MKTAIETAKQLDIRPSNRAPPAASTGDMFAGAIPRDRDAANRFRDARSPPTLSNMPVTRFTWLPLACHAHVVYPTFVNWPSGFGRPAAPRPAKGAVFPRQRPSGDFVQTATGDVDAIGTGADERGGRGTKPDGFARNRSWTASNRTGDCVPPFASRTKRGSTWERPFRRPRTIPLRSDHGLRISHDQPRRRRPVAFRGPLRKSRHLRFSPSTSATTSAPHD
jgi:hypothetical protein